MEWLHEFLELPTGTVLIFAGLGLIFLAVVDKLFDRVSIAEKLRIAAFTTGIGLTASGVAIQHYFEGTGPVPNPGPPKVYYVQFGAMATFAAARELSETRQEELKEVLTGTGPLFIPFETQNGEKLIRVRFGPISAHVKAQAICRASDQIGIPCLITS